MFYIVFICGVLKCQIYIFFKISAKTLQDDLEDLSDELTREMQQFMGALEVKMILVFVTGTDRVPAAGFTPSPRVVFTHQSCLPSASTCSNQLQLYVNERSLALPTFCLDFVVSLMNSETFTRA